MWYLLPLGPTATAAHSLPHPENERQWSLKDFWSCIFGNLHVALWQ